MNRETLLFRRPGSLSEFAEALAAGNEYDWSLGEFLDAFYGAPPKEQQEMIQKEPELLAGKIGNGVVMDAYLAATAEYLAWHHGLENPEWTQVSSRVLREPWFATDIRGLWPLVSMESPAAFRRRNLFVSGNALSRA